MVVGSPRTYTVKKGESLIELARRFDLGYNEITVTNPSLDPFVPGDGASVLLPTSWVLPYVGVYKGIVINLSELRLYYFFERHGSKFVRTFPVGIGAQGKDTPVGEFTVIEKITGPAWHVPESIRKESPWLPQIVPPGPDNPLGSHALRLSLGDVLIHGTNRPYAVGRRDSHGCIRLYPEDITRLFGAAPDGVRVTIVRQPVKVGMRGGRVYAEVHRENAQGDDNFFDEAVRLLTKKKLLKYVNTEKLYRVIEQGRGIPVDISD
jgi:L,D-transpeptidase ErfK/SrfK